MSARNDVEEIARSLYPRHGGILIELQFQEDFANLFTIRRMSMKFLRGAASFNEKLMINHVVQTLNVFGPTSSTRLLSLAMPEPDIFAVVKSILKFLGTYDGRFMRDDVESNRIMDDILRDTKHRYNLDHI